MLDPKTVVEIKHITRLCLPVVGAQLSFMAINVADTVMAGRLSARDLAAVAVGNSYVMPFYLVCMGILMAVNPIVAHLYGANKLDQIGDKLHQCLYLAAALSIPSVLALNSARPLLGYMGIETEVADLAADYLRYYSFALPAALGFMALRFFNEALSVVKPTMVVMTLAVPLNIFGNWVFMYGNLGFPAMGAAGIGLASTLDMVFVFLVLACWTWRHQGKTYHLWRLVKPNLAALREQLALGVPNGVSLGMEITMFALIALFIASMGETEVGAHQIALNIGSVTFMLPLGISMALGIRVGQAAGRGDMEAVSLSGKAGLLITICVQLGLALMMWLGARFLVSLYTKEPAVLELGTTLLLFAAVFQLSDGLQVVGSGALRGLKDTKIPMIANMVAYWGFGLPIGYYLAFPMNWGPTGFWSGMVAGLSLAAILHNWRFYRLLRSREPAGP